MYDDQYGLSGRPFQLTPDPAFWFDTATHKKAMAYLGYGLSQGEGFIVITGAPGVGKTTLVGHLMATIDPEQLHVVKLVTTQIASTDLLHLVAAGLGVDGGAMGKAQLLASIEKQLHAVAREGRRTLLIVDEAQALPFESLEELRMLSNFQAGGYPLLQIFLLGQPEFRARLSDPRLDQLRQRVIAMHQLDPMGLAEVEPYLIHRLSIVGWRGKPRFTNDALAAMHRWSGGIPRKLNLLASRVMLLGAIEQIDSFTGEDVEAVIADLDHDLNGTAPASTAPANAVAIEAPAPAAEAMGAVGGEVVTPAPAPVFAGAAPAATLTVTPENAGPGFMSGSFAGSWFASPVTAPVPGLRPVPQAAPEPQAQAAPTVEASTAPSPDTAALLERIAQLEAQMLEQDAALRRVLSLMVNFVEVGDRRGPDQEAAA